MARYLIQSDSKGLSVENKIITELLNDSRVRHFHEYKMIDTASLSQMSKPNDVPIGDIKFITKWLNLMYGIEKENHIEIPTYLRTDEFLKRDYNIVSWDKIPEYGAWFVKDVSELKLFGQIINLTYQNIKDYFEKPESSFSTNLVLDKSHLFAVSRIYDIQSEYRVYVINNKIEAIANYNGDCTILPDVNLLKKITALIEYNEKWLKSYTIDVMVGLYNTLWGDNLLYAYKDGIDYLLNDNKPITPTL